MNISDGVGAADPSSDWNAPTEVWGNYDEPKAQTPPAQEKPISQVPMVSLKILSNVLVHKRSNRTCYQDVLF